MTSSRRFKEEIKPMDKTSEVLFALKPVTFRYNKKIDPAGTSQVGLVAEEVEKVNPNLVVRDKEGKPYSVRYDQVNAMLLNEFLKEHKKVEHHPVKINCRKTRSNHRTAAERNGSADRASRRAGVADPEDERPAGSEHNCTTTGRRQLIRPRRRIW
jgi:hypothetical protein